MANTLHTVTTEVGSLLSALDELLASTDRTKAVLAVLGWETPPGLDELGLVGIDLKELLEKFDTVATSSEADWDNELLMAARIADLAAATGNLVLQIQDFSEHLPAELGQYEDYFNRTNIHKELPRRLLDLLIASYLGEKSPLAYSFLRLVNLIEQKHLEADPQNFQTEHIRTIIHYDDISKVLRDPIGHMRQVYKWGTPEFYSAELVARIGQVLDSAGASTNIRPMNLSAEQVLTGRTLDESNTPPAPQLVVTLYEQLGMIGGLQIGFSVFPVRPSAENASDGGIGLLPILKGEAQDSIPLNIFDDTFFEFSADVDLLKNIALIQQPNQLTIRKARTIGDLGSGRFAVGIRYGQSSTEPKSLVSFPGGSSLTIQQFTLMGGVDKSGDSVDSFIEMGLVGCKATLSLSDADGFITKTVNRKQLDASFDLKIGWNSAKGIYFQGSTDLNVTLPLNVNLGPIYLQSIHLGLDAEEGALQVETSATGNLTLGPLLVTLERVGLDVDVAFGSGNLGLLNLSPDFKPPTSVGIAIDTHGFRGGGFLRIDPPNYAGMLALTFQNEIELTAFGLITTRLPDGKPGFSLVLSILAEFQPIQLGLGFALNGVGGLIGINRQFNEEGLKQAFKTHALDDVLFPASPIKDAVKLFDALQSILPPREGYHVIGPMARLFWGGTLRLVNFEIGIFIQLGGAPKVVLLGHAWSRLPNEQAPLLVINVDVLGIIDFGEDRVAFDATLFDSRIMDIHLDGQMALRADWSEGEENFALSVGGFHPQFQQIPAGFPQLRRLAMVMGENPRLSLTMYLAITTNTLQVGAKLELWAKKLGFTITGGASFDALFTFSPFSFLVNIKVWVNVKRGWIDLGLWLELELTGPNPIVAAGYVKIKLGWFFSVKVRFRAEFGKKIAEPLPAVSPLAVLKDELLQPRAVRAQLPAWASAYVAFTAAAENKIDPIADLQIVQNAVPLNFTMDKFGGGVPVASERRLRFTAGLTNEQVMTRLFAGEQFKNWTVEERLAAKPFEQLEAGIGFSGSYVIPEEHKEERAIVFETVLRESKEYLDSLPVKDFRKVAIRTACVWQPQVAEAVLLRNWSQFGAVNYYQPGRPQRDEASPNFVKVLDVRFATSIAEIEQG